MSNRWVSDWSLPLDDMHDLEQWGEEVSWLAKTSQQTYPIKAIVTRASRMHREQGDQQEEVAIGQIKIRAADVPEAGERDVVTVPVSFQAGDTEKWVVSDRTDLDNGTIQFTCFLFQERRYRTVGLEREPRYG